MANTTAAYNLLINGSIIKGGFKAYEYSMGFWLWPILFIFTLVMVHIKTENPGYLLAYAILGNALLASRLTVDTSKIFYLTLVISLALVLHKIYASKRLDS